MAWTKPFLVVRAFIDRMGVVKRDDKLDASINGIFARDERFLIGFDS